MQVEGQHESSDLMATGGRVRNAYATCPVQGDSPKKFGLIPHIPTVSHVTIGKDLLVQDGHASD